MRTLGVDLSSGAARTGACVVEWSRSPVVRELVLGADDDRIVALAAGCDVVAIDAPFGWPGPFTEMLAAWHARELPRLEAWTTERRDAMRFRLTDLHVAKRMGRPPLSVSSDRVALPAMRCASLLVALGVADRSLGGRVVEAYPAAALHAWGIATRGTRSESGGARLAAEVLDRLPFLEVAPADRARLARERDLLDALTCSLVARAAARGRVEAPPPGHEDRLAREGWIAVPTCRPEDLAQES